ncbi:hypothetical protein CJP74_06715 [Psittacicella melopsittaci]|uniref:Positive regulator of sigma(E), RseC/MucC n=1 Tax=Psittacicella melopsittaci TaxID=2028576 RepID=A0A3A1Y399_9GAMM|nr:SoxR reducing system RseC family protein [Psittacicella melopsittaci]RIY31688.1 hypothetical protein CJP74_06715 [Psittacicella melopsittaci]
MNEIYRNAQVESIEIKDNTAFIKARMLTNKEFCSACARGEGCGAIFFNQLTSLGRNKNLVELSAQAAQIKHEQLAVGDVIKIETSRASFWLGITIFYLVPLIVAVLIPSFFLYLFQVSDLISALVILISLIAYYLVASSIFKSYQAKVKYAGLDYSLNNQPAPVNLDNFTGKFNQL